MSRTGDIIRKLLSGTVFQKPPPLSLRRVQPGHSLLVALEPRLVYDGAVAATAVVAAEQAAPGDAAADGHSDTATASADHHDATDAASHDAALPAAQAGIDAAPAPRVEIAFIDRNIRDADALAKSLDGKVQVYWLDPAQNGVAQIGEVLSHYAQVDAVHIYSHADAKGELILGSTVVDINNVDAYKQNLNAWSGHLAQGADIMLYGCDLAAGANGHALVDKIADYTHADVAASDDLTGAASAGGDWDLEVHHGIIETAVLADRDFDGVLTAPVLTGWDSTTLDTAAAQAGPVIIDSDVTLTSGLANYSGWQMLVSSPQGSEDLLFVRDEGSGAGQVGVQDAGGGYYLINYGGSSIGYALQGAGAFVIYFTDGFGTVPTNAMVERVIENITYRNISGTPTTSRQIDLQFAPNGGGGSSPLSLIDTETNGQDGASGLAGQSGVTMSADGKFVYVTTSDEDSIVTFSRDTTTSVLTYVGKLTNGSGGLTDMTAPTGIDISSDGKSVYVDDRNSGKVYFFQRNTSTGALTYSASYTLPGGSYTGDLAISPDQTRVFVTRIGSLSIYNRNTTTGALTYIGYTSWTASGGGNTPEMVVSPDGNSIYTAWGPGDFSFITRNPSTDALTRQAVTLPGGFTALEGLTMSADGKCVYLTSADANGVAVFSRNTTTGALTLVTTYYNNTGGVSNLSSPREIRISADGLYAFVATESPGGIVLFTRDTTTGELTYSTFFGASNLNSVTDMFLTPDGKAIYTTQDSFSSSTLNAFAFDSSIASGGSDALNAHITLTLGVANHAPTGADKTVTINEDASYTFAAGDFGFSDVDGGDSLSAVRIDSLPVNGTLKLSGVAVTVGQVIATANLGNLVFTPASNANGAAYANFNFSVRDQSNAYDAAPNKITVNVTAVNDAPTGADKTVTIDEDTSYTFAAGDFGFSDVDAGDSLSGVRIDSLPANGTLKLSGVAVTVGQVITTANLGNLVFTPAADANGAAYASFTFSVRDQASAFDAAPNTLTVNVTPVADLPVITGWDPTASLQENTVNAGWVLLDSSVSVSGDGNYDFTMILSTAIFGGAQNIDQLGIRNQGTGAGQIGVSGNTITYGGVAIATYFNGGETDSNARDLIIAFNGTASNAAVKALIENIQYANLSDNPTATRTVTMRLEEGGLKLVGTADQMGQIGDYWSDGTYYYRAQTAGGLGAFSFDGTDLHAIRNYNTSPDQVLDIEGDGTYIYYTVGNKLGAARFDGTNWTALDNYDLGAATQSVYCKNGYIFVTDGANGVAAFTFDGTSLHLVASVDTPDFANHIWSDGTYYYVTDNSQLIAYSFNGTSFTQRGSIAVAGSLATGVDGDGTYIYVSSPVQSNTLSAYSFDGTTFTQRATYAIPGATSASDVQVYGGRIYLASGKEGLQVFSFNGSAFSLLSTQDRVSANSTAQGVYVDASGNVFLANRNEATSVFRYSDPTSIAVYQKVLTVNAENDAPTGADKTITTNEDTAYTFSAADFGFGDVDNGDSLSAVRIDTLPGAGTLKLSGVAVTVGQVISAANIGNLVFTPAADANGAAYANFSFSVRDQSNAYDVVPNTITVNVTPVNDAPTGADKTVTINEDTSYTFSAADFGFSDIDSGDSLSAVRIDSLPTAGTLKLSGVAVTLGQVITAANIGNLVFTPAADANGAAYANFNFSVRDQANAYDAAPNKITVDVTPVNDAPTGADKTVVTNEDVSYTFAAGDFGFGDVDSGDTLSAVRIDSLPVAGTLKLSGVAVTLGQVITAANIGNLVFTPAADANGAAYANFNFSVRDQSNAYDAAPNKITIDVTAVNDAPTGADKTITTNEDTPYTFSAADFGFSDVDSGDSLSAVRIDSLPGAGTLKLSGVAVTLGQVISAANIGNLVFTPAADANGAAYANFNFSVRDQANAYDAAPNKITVDVTPVNDAPMGADKTVTTNEDTSYTFSAADFGFSDVDSGDSLSAVRIDSLPAAGTLKLSGVDVTLGQVITAANIGNLVFTPSADANGAAYASFDFSVRDQSNIYDAAPNKITVDVAAINDAPTGADRTVTIDEDTSYTFAAGDFGFSDIDSGDALSAVRIDSLPAAGTLKLSGVAVTLGQVITAANIGNLVFTPAADANGAGYASFDFSVRDQSNAYDAAPNKITVDVTPVNDAPSGTDKTVTTNEDTSYFFTPGDFGFTDIDTGDGLSAIRIDSLPANGRLKLSGISVTAGQVIDAADIAGLAFIPSADANGAAYASFNFTVRDASNAYDAAPNKITIDVTPVNDAPAGADKTVTVNEDAAYTFTAADFGFSDVDSGDSLSAVRIDSLPVNGTLKLSGVDVTLGQVIATANISHLVFAPAANANGASYASFDFSVRDQSNAYDAAPNTITVDVTPVNDAPTGADKTVTIDEDTAYTFAAADFGFADIDGGDSLSAVRINSLPAGGTLKLSGVGVTAGQVIAAADLGNLIFTPAANGNGAAYAHFSFSVRDQSNAYDAAPNTLTVDVTPVNDAPAGHDATITVNQDGTRGFAAADFGFADIDSGDSLSAVRLDVPGAGVLALYGVAVTPGQVVTAADIAGLTYTPAAGTFGDAYAQITFKVRDSAGAFSAASNTLTVNVHKVGPTVAEDLATRKPEEPVPPAAAPVPPPAVTRAEPDFVPIIASMLDKIRDVTAKQTMGRGVLPEEHAYYNVPHHTADKVTIQRVSTGESNAISLTELKKDLSQAPGARLAEVSLLDGSRVPEWISINDAGDQLVVTPPHGLTGIVNLSLRVETRNGPILVPLRLDIENGAVMEGGRFAMSFQDQLARQSEYHLSNEVEREVRRLIGE